MVNSVKACINVLFTYFAPDFCFNSFFYTKNALLFRANSNIAKSKLLICLRDDWLCLTLCLNLDKNFIFEVYMTVIMIADQVMVKTELTWQGWRKKTIDLLCMKLFVIENFVFIKTSIESSMNQITLMVKW